jgi:hypothetical protein
VSAAVAERDRAVAGEEGVEVERGEPADALEGGLEVAVRRRLEEELRLRRR